MVSMSQLPIYHSLAFNLPSVLVKSPVKKSVGKFSARTAPSSNPTGSPTFRKQTTYRANHKCKCGCSNAIFDAPNVPKSRIQLSSISVHFLDILVTFSNSSPSTSRAALLHAEATCPSPWARCDGACAEEPGTVASSGGVILAGKIHENQ